MLNGELFVGAVYLAGLLSFFLPVFFRYCRFISEC